MEKKKRFRGLTLTLLPIGLVVYFFIINNRAIVDQQNAVIFNNPATQSVFFWLFHAGLFLAYSVVSIASVFLAIFFIRLVYSALTTSMKNKTPFPAGIVLVASITSLFSFFIIKKSPEQFFRRIGSNSAWQYIYIDKGKLILNHLWRGKQKSIPFSDISAIEGYCSRTDHPAKKVYNTSLSFLIKLTLKDGMVIENNYKLKNQPFALLDQPLLYAQYDKLYHLNHPASGLIGITLYRCPGIEHFSPGTITKPFVYGKELYHPPDLPTDSSR